MTRFFFISFYAAFFLELHMPHAKIFWDRRENEIGLISRFLLGKQHT